MSGKTIVSQSPALRNEHSDAFCLAFDIPQQNNRIFVATTRPFFLGNYPIPAGSVGWVADLVCNGSLYLIDFGLPLVCRVPVGSDLIRLADLAEKVEELQADVTRFEASLTELERDLAGLAQKWGASDES
jgi:hypothetical protein